MIVFIIYFIVYHIVYHIIKYIIHQIISYIISYIISCIISYIISSRSCIQFFEKPGPRPRQDSRLNFFTDQNRDGIQDWIFLRTKTETRSRSLAVVPGGYGSRKKARVNSSLSEADPPQWPLRRCNTFISSIFCNYSFKIYRKEGYIKHCPFKYLIFARPENTK